MENNLFETREEYFKMVDAWKKHATEIGCSTEALGIYALLRGKDWRAGLSPNTNPDLIKWLYYKLTEGTFKYLDLTPFNGTVTEELIQKMRSQEIPQWAA